MINLIEHANKCLKISVLKGGENVLRGKFGTMYFHTPKTPCRLTPSKRFLWLRACIEFQYLDSLIYKVKSRVISDKFFTNTQITNSLNLKTCTYITYPAVVLIWYSIDVTNMAEAQ